jgi:hypothetical protein
MREHERRDAIKRFGVYRDAARVAGDTTTEAAAEAYIQRMKLARRAGDAVEVGILQALAAWDDHKAECDAAARRAAMPPIRYTPIGSRRSKGSW